MVLGALVLIALGSAYGYGIYAQRVVEADMAARRATLAALPTPTPTSTPTATPTIVPPPTPLPTPTPVPLPAVRMVISSIELDTDVVEMGIADGEWQVPKFVVGHLASTAFANETGNGVYSGHVESISSGNVFANLSEVVIGDEIRLDTTAGVYTYTVSEIKTVPNDDLSVLAESPDQRITLITCAGTFNPVIRDYTHRLVVIATLASDSVQ